MPAPGARNLLLFGGVSSRYSYLLRDEFSTAQAAPLTSPRTCEPGPGTATITDVDNNAYISGGRLIMNSGAGEALCTYQTNTFTRITGLAFGCILNNTTGLQQILVEGTGGYIFRIFVQNGALEGMYPSSGAESLSHFDSVLSTDQYPWMILRSTGAFFIWNGQLIYVDNVGTRVSPRLTLFTQNTPNLSRYGSARVIPMGLYDSRFATDNGLATTVVALPVLSSTAAHEANCLIELTGKIPTVDSTQILYRSTADNAGWRVDINTDGKVYLQELNGGTTERANAAHGRADGAAYRVVIRVVGNVHWVYINDSRKIAYTDAGNFNNTATAAKILAVGTDDVLSNLITWPRTVTLPVGI